MIDASNEELSVYEDDQNTNIRKCIVSGFFMNCAHNYREEVYKTVKNNLAVRIHPSSMLQKDLPDCLIYHELVLTSQEYMRNVIEVDKQWLIEIAPHFYKLNDFHNQESKRRAKKMQQAEENNPN